MRSKMTGIVCVLVTVLLFGGLVPQVVEPLQSRALVVVWEEMYFPGIDGMLETLQLLDGRVTVMTAGMAREAGYRANPAYRENGFFTGARQTLLRYCLERAGLLLEKTRWSKDGTWRW